MVHFGKRSFILAKVLIGGGPGGPPCTYNHSWMDLANYSTTLSTTLGLLSTTTRLLVSRSFKTGLADNIVVFEDQMGFVWSEVMITLPVGVIVRTPDESVIGSSLFATQMGVCSETCLNHIPT
ncbi:hypothetical protein RHGRI_037374 [Rhododendron griersonianum]|uniref:Uncharacterized protein n=1 Tax=Rhododendron griersonianum TaxID=479676 RepID=A0AAV6HVR3_9ERIC|nr:hypothetical protein RHGRI_037374 [Rhododendron griersonianum]